MQNFVHGKLIELRWCTRELKRRTKQREKDAKKAEKAASAPAKPQAVAVINEDELNPNVSTGLNWERSTNSL